MTKQNKKKFFYFSIFIFSILFLCFAVFILSGCRTIYIKAELPEYKIENIERPKITEQSEDVVKLMRYAQKKEIQLDNFKTFYENLRNDNANK